MKPELLTASGPSIDVVHSVEKTVYFNQFGFSKKKKGRWSSPYLYVTPVIIIDTSSDRTFLVANLKLYIPNKLLSGYTADSGATIHSLEIDLFYISHKPSVSYSQ